MTSETVKELRQLADEARRGGSFAEVTLSETATLIESQAKELAFLKSQNERLVKLLDRCVHAVEQEYGTDNWRVEEAKALLAELKPATVSVEARGANA